jgi:NRAMP (natural resistance-associated macrophage protein)-like metal ion transporter
MPHNLYLHSALVQYRSPLIEEERIQASKNNDETEIVHLNRSPVNSTAQLTPLNHRRSSLSLFSPDTRSLPAVNGSLCLSDATATKSYKTLPDHRFTDIKNSLRILNLDSFFSLFYAFLVNSAILIVAASALAGTSVETLHDAYNLLSETMGKFSATLFALGLLFAGQSSTITGTLAGQIVMEGFLESPSHVSSSNMQNIQNTIVGIFRRNVWLRRLVTRGLAVIPALVVSLALGPSGVDMLLVLSQVILSLLLPFAVWPLIYFTCSKSVMVIQYVPSSDEFVSGVDGTAAVVDPALKEKKVSYVNSWLLSILAVGVGLFITGLNVYLLTQVPSQFS